MVDPLLLTTIMEGQNPCATIRDERTNSNRAYLAQFVTVALVARSSLLRTTPDKRDAKAIQLLLPSLVLDNVQTCLSLAFGCTDVPMCSQIMPEGMEFTTRRNFHAFFGSVGRLR